MIVGIQTIKEGEMEPTLEEKMEIAEEVVRLSRRTSTNVIRRWNNFLAVLKRR
jgi:hypothetical protein